MRVAAAALVGVALVAGCDGATTHIDDQAAALLQAEIRMARDAAASGDVPRAAALLESVDDTVARLRDDGRLSDSRAAAVLAALGDVEDALTSWAATTTTTTTTTTSPPPADGDGDEDRDDEGKGDGDQEGKRDGERGRGRGGDGD